MIRIHICICLALAAAEHSRKALKKQQDSKFSSEQACVAEIRSIIEFITSASPLFALA